MPEDNGTPQHYVPEQRPSPPKDIKASPRPAIQQQSFPSASFLEGEIAYKPKNVVRALEPVSMTAQQQVTSISPEEAAGKWSSFIEAARKERIAVGAMLGETHLLDIKADRLRIGCPDDFHMDALKRNRQFLTDLAHRVYGAKVILETILAQEQPATTQLPSEHEKRPAIDQAVLQHPVVQALKTEFAVLLIE